MTEDVDLMHEILRAIPADDFELRRKVTNYFERITTLNLQSHFDSQLIAAYRTTKEELRGHEERLAVEGLVGAAKPFVDHTWKTVTKPYESMETLWSRLTIVKPEGYPRG